MAGKQYQDEFSTEDYYANGMLRETPEVPSNHPRKSKNTTPSGRQKKRAAAGKYFLIILVALIAVILIVSLVVFISKRKNDGKRFAKNLADCIGSSMQDTQKNAKNVSLLNQSDYAAIDQMLQPFAACVTSRKEAVVQGVHVPEWNIICRTNEDVLSEVWFYDYTVLESTPYGTKRKAYLDITQIASDSNIASFEDVLGLKPYCIHYNSDFSQTREYRYCFEDAETNNLSAYIITATWDKSETLLQQDDRRVDFLTAILRTSME